MVDTRREESSDSPAGRSPSTDSVTNGPSVAILYAIGRFQTARLQARVVTHLQSAQGPTQDGFGELVTDAKELLRKIDSLIARVPTQGIPERGYTPSRLANASLSTHPSLYKDDTSQPTVFAAWTRIMLTLMKSEISILLQKPFLGPPDNTNERSRKSWTRYELFGPTCYPYPAYPLRIANPLQLESLSIRIHPPSPYCYDRFINTPFDRPAWRSSAWITCVFTCSYIKHLRSPHTRGSARVTMGLSNAYSSP